MKTKNLDFSKKKNRNRNLQFLFFFYKIVLHPSRFIIGQFICPIINLRVTVRDPEGRVEWRRL